MIVWSLLRLGFHPWAISSEDWGSDWSVHCQIHLSVEKVNCGQLCLILWIWRWERVGYTSFMLKQVLFDMSKLKNEENKVRTKIAKNRKWLVMEVSKNGKFLTSKLHVQGSFKWKFVQHESCRSCSHLSKKSKNLKFPCMVGKLWSIHFPKRPIIKVA